MNQLTSSLSRSSKSIYPLTDRRSQLEIQRWKNGQFQLAIGNVINESQEVITQVVDLAVIGSIPPPFGGVSVHIKRSLRLLDEICIDWRLYSLNGQANDYGRISPFRATATSYLYWLATIKAKAIHLHINRLPAWWAAGIVLPFRKLPYVVTVHSHRPMREYLKSNSAQKRLTRRFLENAAHVISVSEAIQEELLQCGIVPLASSIIPAYLPPPHDELDDCNIPCSCFEFLRQFRKVIGTHGWFGYMLVGQHVYGFDQIARLVASLAESHSDIGVYTIVSGCYDAAHRAQVLAFRRDHKLERQWLIVEMPFSACALFRHTSLFLRPTLTDGDSVSIRECLDIGIPVVASDTVVRPPGCILFKVGDFSEMMAKVLSQMEDSTCGGLTNDREVFSPRSTMSSLTELQRIWLTLTS